MSSESDKSIIWDILSVAALAGITISAYAAWKGNISPQAFMRISAILSIPLLKSLSDLMLSFASGIEDDRKRYGWKVAVTYGSLGAGTAAAAYGILGPVILSPASIGILTAVLAYVLQKPLINAFAWSYIIIFKPFSIGDRIEIDGIIGDVYSIDIFNTRMKLRGENHEPTGTFVSVPNERVFSGKIRNLTHPSRYIWDRLVFSVTYESDIRRAQEIIIECLEKSYRIPEEDAEMIRSIKREFLKPSDPLEPFTRLGLSESSINISLHYLVRVDIIGEVRKRIIENVVDAVRSSGRVEFAYPHVTVIRKSQTNI